MTKLRGAIISGLAAGVISLGPLAFAQGMAMIDPGSPSVKNVQALITKLKGDSPGVQEISVHAKTAGDKINIVASTNSDMTGKPSSAKDTEVIEGGSLSIRNEAGVFDIKVPLKGSGGQVLGTAGIKLVGQDGLTIPKAKQQASDIAKQIEQALAGAS